MRGLALIFRQFPFAVLLGAGAFALWAGLQPPPPPPPPEIPPAALAAAYAPKPPKPPPPVPPDGGALTGSIEAPEEVWLGEPIEIALVVTNTGTVPLNKIVLWCHLPEETHTRQLATLVRFTKEKLAPGETFRRTELLIAKRSGALELTASFRSVEGVDARANAIVRLPTAVLIIEPVTSSDPSARCFAISNVGQAPARDVLVRLTPSDQPNQLWPMLASGEQRTACFAPQTPESEAFQWIEASATAADAARVPFSTAHPK